MRVEQILSVNLAGTQSLRPSLSGKRRGVISSLDPILVDTKISTPSQSLCGGKVINMHPQFHEQEKKTEKH